MGCWHRSVLHPHGTGVPLVGVGSLGGVCLFYVHLCVGRSNAKARWSRAKSSWGVTPRCVSSTRSLNSRSRRLDKMAQGLSESSNTYNEQIVTDALTRVSAVS